MSDGFAVVALVALFAFMAFLSLIIIVIFSPRMIFLAGPPPGTAPFPDLAKAIEDHKQTIDKLDALLSEMQHTAAITHIDIQGMKQMIAEANKEMNAPHHYQHSGANILNRHTAPPAKTDKGPGETDKGPGESQAGPPEPIVPVSEFVY